MSDKDGVYFGLDISNKYTVISFYNSKMSEPASVSTVLGQENYAIPTLISKKKGVSQWFFGEEARKRSLTGEAILVSDIYLNALEGLSVNIEGQQYEYRELLVLYLNKLLSLPGVASAKSLLKKFVVCLDQVTLGAMELMTYVVMKLDIEASKLTLIDKRESFYYYSLSQKPELFLYNVCIFDYTGNNLISIMLKRNQTTRPQVVTLESANHGELFDNRDSLMEQIAVDTIGSEIVSSIYLVGDGFDGDWMKTSLTRMCRGRKVFMGKNLYSKGACYAGFIKDDNRDWPFIYIGDNELKLNLSIKILDENEMKFFSLIDAGQSWYDAKGECEIILDGEPDIEFWIQKLDSREAHLEVLELTDMPERENRTTRLRVEAIPVSDKAIDITITDLGFGEICPSTGKTWEHTISLG